MAGLSGGEFKTETPSDERVRIRAAIEQFRKEGLLSG